MTEEEKIKLDYPFNYEKAKGAGLLDHPEFGWKSEEEKWEEEFDLVWMKTHYKVYGRGGPYLIVREYYLAACRKRQEEIERLKGRVKDVEEILKYAMVKEAK